MRDNQQRAANDPRYCQLSGLSAVSRMAGRDFLALHARSLRICHNGDVPGKNCYSAGFFKLLFSTRLFTQVYSDI